MVNWSEGSDWGCVDSNPKGSIEGALLTAKHNPALARKNLTDLSQELTIDRFQISGEP